MSVRTLPSILMNLCMQIFLTSSPVRAYFSRLRRKMMRGRHSLSLWGPVDGRGACRQKLSAGGSSSINHPREGNHGAKRSRKSTEGQQHKVKLPRRQRPAETLCSWYSQQFPPCLASLIKLLPTEHNHPSIHFQRWKSTIRRLKENSQRPHHILCKRRKTNAIPKDLNVK